jgi:hypothetical protein
MNSRFHSLITADARAGLALAGELADELHGQLARSPLQAERPGGMNYLSPAPIPREVTAGILFYAIAAANHGWTNKVS